MPNKPKVRNLSLAKDTGSSFPSGIVLPSRRKQCRARTMNTISKATRGESVFVVVSMAMHSCLIVSDERAAVLQDTDNVMLVKYRLLHFLLQTKLFNKTNK